MTLFDLGVITTTFITGCLKTVYYFPIGCLLLSDTTALTKKYIFTVKQKQQNCI